MGKAEIVNYQKINKRFLENTLTFSVPIFLLLRFEKKKKHLVPLTILIVRNDTI